MERNENLMSQASRLFDTLTYKWMSQSASDKYLDRLSHASRRAETRRDRRTLQYLFRAS